MKFIPYSILVPWLLFVVATFIFPNGPPADIARR